MKLDAPDLVLDLSELHAADVAGRARSFGAFVKAGVHPEDAARETGVTLTRPVREDGSSTSPACAWSAVRGVTGAAVVRAAGAE